MNAIVAGLGIGGFLVILSWGLSRIGDPRGRVVFYPGVAGLGGSILLLILSFTVIGGWEGIAFAFIAVPVFIISGLMLLFLTSYRKQT